MYLRIMFILMIGFSNLYAQSISLEECRFRIENNLPVSGGVFYDSTINAGAGGWLCDYSGVPANIEVKGNYENPIIHCSPMPLATGSTACLDREVCVATNNCKEVGHVDTISFVNATNFFNSSGGVCKVSSVGVNLNLVDPNEVSFSSNSEGFHEYCRSILKILQYQNTALPTSTTGGT